MFYRIGINELGHMRSDALEGIYITMGDACESNRTRC
jgi:hypothetical protein